MNKNLISPYVRRAMYSTLQAPFTIHERIIFDHELIYVQNGTCTITVDGKTYTVKKGDVIFFPPDVPHKLHSPKDDLVQPHIHFDGTYSNKSEETYISFQPKSTMNEYELSLIQENVFKDSDVPYVFTPVDKQRFLKLFFEIIEIFQNKKQDYILQYKIKMTKLLALIYDQFEKRTETPALGEDTRKLIPSVKNYLDNNFRESVTLDGLAAQFYINKFTLLRNFKAAYGLNPIHYYRKKRLAYAKKLLEDTDLSITATADELNFTDVYTFSRFFKAQTGLSPKEYRLRS